MKKFIIINLFLLLLSVQAVFSADSNKLPYRNIEESAKIKLSAENWTDKLKDSDSDIFQRGGNDFYTPNGDFAFGTGCRYLFLNNGRLLGYSEYDMNYYEFNSLNEIITKRLLDEEEVACLFKDFKIIKISEFAETTNSYKFKKGKGAKKILLLNDTNRDFSNYIFLTNNAKFNRYDVNNMIEITKKGLIYFSRYGENSKTAPWFILLVR